MGWIRDNTDPPPALLCERAQRRRVQMGSGQRDRKGILMKRSWSLRPLRRDHASPARILFPGIAARCPRIWFPLRSPLARGEQAVFVHAVSRSDHGRSLHTQRCRQT